VAEAAIALAKRRGERAFYTTPIKALSNQKFGDLRAVYGEDAVGLLTGDNVVNGDAGIVVMTTEVLRNMIYTDPHRLGSLGIVILDEVHYLQDRYRGPVWEEVIIHLPAHVQLVNLSATIANPEEFADWVRARRGPTELVVETHRPVPLDSVYMLKDRHREDRVEVFPVFDRSKKHPNPVVEKLLRKGRGRFRRFLAPRRLEVVEHLAGLGLLPAIYFVFSRAGCDQAAQQVASAGLSLTTAEEKTEIRATVEERTAHLGQDDLTVLGFGSWLAGLESGVAAHHAGMVPAFKETVEAVFSAGLVKVVFATETLALGINMPAKAVVLERLSKFTGETHEMLQPGDYTQLTGRAGRRGIDTSGTAVVLHQRDVPFDKVAAIAAQGSHPLVSSFAPTYNMAVNLVANYPQERAEELLMASFAQHRLDVRRNLLAERLAERRREADEFRTKAACARGDVAAYTASGAVTDVRQRMRDLAQASLPGDVFEMPGPKGPQRWALVARGYGPNPRLMLVGESGDLWRLAAEDLSPASIVVGTVELPEPFRPRDRSYRRAVAKAIAAAPRVVRMGAAADDRLDPVATCPDLAEHLGWLDRAAKAERDAARLERRLDDTGGDLVARFRSILGLLETWGYTDGWSLTPKGRRLRFIYNELDLVVAETAERGLLDQLDAAELAGMMTLFVYEPRRDDVAGELPGEQIPEAVEHILALGDELAIAEDARRLEPTRPPNDGYVWRIHDWAAGATLDDLFDEEAAAGDFVRIARQTLDLLRQVRDAYPELREIATEALDRVDRGVVAAEGRW
jgi:ATP-dependent RNA helicase HelY